MEYGVIKLVNAIDRGRVQSAVCSTRNADPAIARFRVAVEREPRNAEALLYLAGALASTGHPADALPYFESTLDRTSDLAVKAHGGGCGGGWKHPRDSHAAEGVKTRKSGVRSATSEALSATSDVRRASPEALMPTTHSALGTPHSALRTAHSALSTPDSRLRTAHSALRTSHFRLLLCNMSL